MSACANGPVRKVSNPLRFYMAMPFLALAFRLYRALAGMQRCSVSGFYPTHASWTGLE